MAHKHNYLKQKFYY